MGLAGFGGRGAAAADGQEEAPSLPYPPRLEPKVQVPQAQSPRRFLIGSWILYTDFIAFLYNSRLSESEGTLENISSTPAAQRRVGAQRVTWSHGQVGSELGDHSTPSWLWAAPRHSPGLACRESACWALWSVTVQPGLRGWKSPMQASQGRCGLLPAPLDARRGCCDEVTRDSGRHRVDLQWTELPVSAGLWVSETVLQCQDRLRHYHFFPFLHRTLFSDSEQVFYLFLLSPLKNSRQTGATDCTHRAHCRSSGKPGQRTG